MRNKKQFIHASDVLQEEIAGKFKVTTRTVRSALHFDTHSPSAHLYRVYALNHGATLYEERENPYNGVKVL